jgi:hypothetical protein
VLHGVHLVDARAEKGGSAHHRGTLFGLGVRGPEEARPGVPHDGPGRPVADTHPQQGETGTCLTANISSAS